MGDTKKKKRMAIIGISSVLLVAMVVAVTVGMNMSRNGSNDAKNDNKSHLASTLKAVKTLCHPTDYKKECEKSLTSEAGNTTDPRELIRIDFNITIKRIGESLKKTDLMHEVEKDPRSKMALDTCKQLMDLSVGEFRRSMDRLRRFDLNNLDEILTNLKVWLSGAVTYQETCLDAFENTTTNAGKKMRDMLKATMHMTSNGLAIITELAKTLSDTDFAESRRRLLQNAVDEPVLGHDNLELPSWVEDRAAVRRLLATQQGKVKPDVVVAKDGSGKFKSINDALKLVPKKNRKPFVIYIKKGVYHEYVEVFNNMTNVVMVGDGGNHTRITGNRNFKDGIGTYKTPTVAVLGDYFVAISIGFENSAGPHKHQAVALRVQGDKSVFYKCSMDGHQDTLYAHTMRQFYRDCTISGTIDFVFGDAVAVFQNCKFVVRKPLDNQQCIVTAQGRKERHQPSGIVIQGGSIVSDPEYYPQRLKNKAYLARPWKDYSRTIFMDTFIGDLIQPDGYMPWQGPKGLTGTETCFYAEFNNKGPGSNKTKRVKWAGVKNLTSQAADNFLPAMFFHGDHWIRVTRIPYDSGVASPKKN